jgi:hypothetical protein
MTLPQPAEVHHIFEAWLALNRIEKPSPKIREITRELRSGLAAMGYGIGRESNSGPYHLKKRLRHTTG